MRPHPSVPRRPRRGALAAAALLSCLAPAGLAAQAAVLPDSGQWQPRGTFAGYFVVAEPKAEFARYVGNGWGFAGHGVLNIGRPGVIGLRVDGGYVNYGRESLRVADPFFGGRIRYDLTTSNNIVFLGVGPQLQLPNRYIRPYGYAVGGFAYLSTTSTLEDIDDQQLARDTNYDDWTPQWAAGGGVGIPIYRGRTSDVALDVGGRYHFNGRARYLREGGIQELPDGTVELEVLESRVHLITWHIGLSVGVR